MTSIVQDNIAQKRAAPSASRSRVSVRWLWRGDHLPLTLGFVLAVAAVSLGYGLFEMGRQYAEHTAIENVSRYTEVIGNVRQLYTSEVVAHARKAGLEITHDYVDKPTALPLPATLTLALGDRLSQAGGTKVRLYSDYPFPWRESSHRLDAFEKDALQALRSRPDEPYFRFEDVSGARILRYASADVMGEACVACHNSYPGSPKTDWKFGDIRGALEIIAPVPSLLEVAPDFAMVAGLAAVICALGLTGIGVMIWQLKKDRHALEQQSAMLSREVAIRRRIQHIDKLRARQLKSANRELEQFAYVASHDLQEPLRKIQAFGERLEARYESELGDQGVDFLRRMRAAANRMAVLINDLLIFSRVSTKKLPMQPVALDEIIEGVLSDLEIAIERAKAEIKIGPMPTLDADKLQMHQLFLNLIGNALKFRAPEMPAKVTIASRKLPPRHEGDDLHWEITVADQGIGFDTIYAERIFGVFQRLHSPGKYPGSGIGLTICRKIVERHHGQIKAVGEPDKGATFIITLPAKQPTEEPHDESAEPDYDLDGG